VIDVGIDESKFPASPLIVVSAIVGNTALMRKLDAEWKRDLTESGVDYFHAKDHWNGSAKAYHGISRDERERLLARLVGHIQHRFCFGASAIVDETEYKSVSSERFRSQYGSAYGFAFQLVMTMILAELIKQGRNNQPVNVLVEQGHANAEQVIGFIRDKKHLNSPKGLRANTYGLGGKKDNPILQAADLLAFGVCELENNGESEFLARLALPKYGKRSLKLPWDKSSVEAAVGDINWNLDRMKAGISGAKRHKELVMW
jgi:hypothetical protein